jgi:hypothetical protein
MKLFLVLFLSSFSSWAEESELEEQMNRCESELDKAEAKVRNYQQTLLNSTVPSANAIDAASNQPITTGNPITDQYAQLNRFNQQMAETKQQESTAMAQAEDDCFSQFERNDDEREQNRRKGYEGLEQMALAENEKQKQLNQIRGTCLTKSMEMAMAERQRLAENYNQRLVSTVGGATQSKKQLANLPKEFNAQCIKAAKYALESADQDLATKMRIYNIRTEEIISADAYLDIKKARLSDYCEQRYDRISKQAQDQKNMIAQNQVMALLATHMALKTAGANGESQQQAYAAYTSLENLLNFDQWNAVKERCANPMSSASGDNGIRPTPVPADVLGAFSEVNKYCRTPATPSGTNCIISTGSESAEKLKRDASSTIQSR